MNELTYYTNGDVDGDLPSSSSVTVVKDTLIRLGYGVAWPAKYPDLADLMEVKDAPKFRLDPEIVEYFKVSDTLMSKNALRFYAYQILSSALPSEASVLNHLGIKPPTEEDVIYAGMEIELEGTLVDSEVEIGDDSINAQAKLLESLDGQGVLKEDYSCGSAYNIGMEVVTAPLTLTQLITFLDGLHLLKYFKVNKYCGVHIHLGLAGLTQFIIGALTVFIHHSDNKDYLERIAGRAFNKYCAHKPGKSNMDSKDRYEALNLTNIGRNQADKRTIELRIFAGTNDVEILKGYVIWTFEVLEWLKTNPSSYLAADFIKYQEQKVNQ